MVTNGGASGAGVRVNGGVDEGFMRRYRELLDAETEAFDELEHSYEDGDRATYDRELTHWRDAVARRHGFLERSGVASSA